MARYKRADAEQGEVVGNEVAGVVSGDGARPRRARPNERHGDRSYEIRDNPNDPACAVSNAVLKVDGKHRLPLAEGLGHEERIPRGTTSREAAFP